jgi:hypothetical protein
MACLRLRFSFSFGLFLLSLTAAGLFGASGFAAWRVDSARLTYYR